METKQLYEGSELQKEIKEEMRNNLILIGIAVLVILITLPVNLYILFSVF